MDFNWGLFTVEIPNHPEPLQHLLILFFITVDPSSVAWYPPNKPYTLVKR